MLDTYHLRISLIFLSIFSFHSAETIHASNIAFILYVIYIFFKFIINLSFMIKKLILEPAHVILVLIMYTSSESSGETVQLHSLARALALRTRQWRFR